MQKNSIMILKESNCVKNKPFCSNVRISKIQNQVMILNEWIVAPKQQYIFWIACKTSLTKYIVINSLACIQHATKRCVTCGSHSQSWSARETPHHFKDQRSVQITTTFRYTHGHHILFHQPSNHDDVIKWIFSVLQAICAGNSPVTGEFPAQRPVTQSFDVFLICASINVWVNNREAGDWRRHCAHCDVTAMELLRVFRNTIYWLQRLSVWIFAIKEHQ